MILLIFFFLQAACKELKHVSDEFVAERVRDINYSLIGWYLQTYGLKNTLALIQWLGVPLFSNTDQFEWTAASPLRTANDTETERKLNRFLNGYDTLESKINYKFRNKAHLLQAVTHESFEANDLTSHYRGLDFLGDAILNYAIVRHLFRQSPDLHANDLDNVSGLIKCNSSIATVSIRNDLHKFLRYTTPTIRDSVKSFATFLQRNKCKPIDDVSVYFGKMNE